MSTLPPPPPIAMKKKTPATPAPPTTVAVAWEDFQIPGVNVPLRRAKGPRRPGVPDIDPHYHFREDLVREVAWALWPHDEGAPSPCLATGPKGCGKTSLFVQIAAWCNWPVMRINLNVGTTVRHLKGRQAARKGGTYFVPGVATTAMETGAILLLDEVSGATPPVALSLFPILEPDGQVFLEDAEPPRYVERHPDFRVVMSDNTIGADQEDTRFNYSGTNPDVNEALLDRIHSVLHVGYLEAEAEHQVIKRRAPDIEDLDLAGIIRVANHVRASDGGFAFSHRMVEAWARRVAAGYVYADGTTKAFADLDLYRAAGPAFLDKMRSKVDRAAVQEVIRRIFEIEAEEG